MSIIIYCGDLHGHSNAMGHIDQLAENLHADYIVQCGDMGFFWPGSPTVEEYFKKRTRHKNRKIPWFVIDGNHENHDELDARWFAAGKTSIVEVLPLCYHVRRNTTITLGGVKHLFCGGAKSTDRGPGDEFYGVRRIWWPQEAPSNQEIEKFHTLLETEQPEVVITHEAPLCMPLYRSGRSVDPTANGFDRALTLSSHKPALWLCGHHHTLEKFEVPGISTDFRCCGLHGQFWLRNTDLNTIEGHEKRL